VTGLPIAIVNLSIAYFYPLIVLAVVFVVLSLVANATSSRETEERFRGYAFLSTVAAAAWSVVVIVAAVANFPNQTWDMIRIVVIICVFFALLIGICFGVRIGYRRVRSL
jgi:cell division protein FtsW (lipid II flippase)